MKSTVFFIGCLNFAFVTVAVEDSSLGFTYDVVRNKRFVSLEENDELQNIVKREAEETVVTTTTEFDGLKLPNETDWWVNATHDVDVDHVYYQEIYHTAEEGALDKYWIDISKLLEDGTAVGKTAHPQLSNSYRRAVSTKLSFKFPFYGYLTENVTIATGGFYYVGEHMHSWLAATQYIAPLMANFETTDDDSNILYADTGELFAVEWRNVMLRHQMEAGRFTFQAVLHKNGDIWFVYKEIPSMVHMISDTHHPRKVGLSDAYLYQHQLASDIYSTLSKRVIYEYHRVEIDPSKLATGVVIEMKANPVCIGIDSCDTCTNSTLENFNCSWCSVKEGGSFCSDEEGLHRRRQDWLLGNCKLQSKSVYCSTEFNELSTTTTKTTTAGPKTPAVTERPTSDAPKPTSNLPPSEQNMNVADQQTDQPSSGTSGIIALVFLLGLLCAVVGWVTYAYYNPHTTSGQLLIRYRPTRWRWPNSDVRYTASVHM